VTDKVAPLVQVRPVTRRLSAVSVEEQRAERAADPSNRLAWRSKRSRRRLLPEVF
jgi:hypothetical protein